MAFLSIVGEGTAEADAGTQTASSSGEIENDGVGLNLSYIYAVNESFWIAPSLSSVFLEEGDDGGEVYHSSLDMHALYKTQSPFFIGGGLSFVSYEEEAVDNNTVSWDEDAIEVSGVAPSLRLGVLFDFSSGALMLDYVFRGEVSEEFTVTAMINNREIPIDGEMSFVSSQLSVNYLFKF